MPQLADIIDLSAHPIDDAEFRARCRQTLERSGALVLPGFLRAAALATVRLEGAEQHHAAFYATSKHNVYLRPQDDALPADHARNRLVVSSKGCITDEDIPPQSPLRALYDAPAFRAFLCAVLDEAQLYPYADRLSSITCITPTPARAGLALRQFVVRHHSADPETGGGRAFRVRGEPARRRSRRDELCRGHAGAGRGAGGQTAGDGGGDLVLFRGRNAMHRVTPTEGDITRMLVVLAYNAQPDVMLSESARMTFYGRL